MENNSQDLMTFGGHLEVLRRMLFRILFVVGILAVVVFCCKNTTWSILLAPSEYDFTTYQMIECMTSCIGLDFKFEEFHIDLIATDLSSQFMTHITTSVYLALLGASPYIIYELSDLYLQHFMKAKKTFCFSGIYDIFVVYIWSSDELFRYISHIFSFFGNL